jgi:hypothetical protein
VRRHALGYLRERAAARAITAALTQIQR